MPGPSLDDPAYTIQACDTLTWSFGDGTTETVVGSNEVTHDYPTPGNYAVSVVIANSLGSATINFAKAMTIATAPSRLAIETKTIVNPKYPFGVCDSCIMAYENSGAVEVNVLRTLDLSRTVSVQVEMTAGSASPVASIQQTLTFGPGETKKTLTVPITDDAVYYGPRWYPLELTHPAGGVLTRQNTGSWPTLFIVEDDPRPVLSIGSGASIVEGNSGHTPFSIPVTLSAPLINMVDAYVIFHAGTATSPADYGGVAAIHIQAGQTTGVISGYIVGDTVAEPDETFTLTLLPNNTNQDPAFGNINATITILNDDAAVATTEAIPTLSVTALALLGAVLAIAALRVLR